MFDDSAEAVREALYSLYLGTDPSYADEDIDEILWEEMLGDDY